MKRFALFITLILATLGSAGPAQAQYCDWFRECCLDTLHAHVQRGLMGRDRVIAEQTCYVYEALEQAPALQNAYCAEIWVTMSQSAWMDVQDGLIPAYPGSCMEDPMSADIPVD